MKRSKLKEIDLYEWDTDIINLSRGKVGECVTYEVQPFLTIPENSYKTKGQPKYKITLLKEQLQKRIEGLIKFHEDRIEHMVKNIETIEWNTGENLVVVMGLELIQHDYESITAIELWLEDVI